MALAFSLFLIAGFSSTGLSAGEFQGINSYSSEEQALEALAQPGAIDKVTESPTLADDVEKLVHRGWHDALRSLVAGSQASSEASAQKVAAQVRHAVYAERNRLDDLIRSLDRNYGKAVDVSPAMQWAQNSTHVFLAVKFAQRWNAPGALEVENETVSFDGNCFNFTAFGEHSFIRKRYHLSFELFKPTVATASSWFLAAAGRVTVMFAKASPANWPQLFRVVESQPKNLGIWRDMRDKWKADLEKLPVEGGETKKSASSTDKKANAKKSKGRKRAAEEDSDDEDDAVDKEIELISECPKSSFQGTSVAELCDKTFEMVAEKPSVAGRRWLIEMYSTDGTGDLEAMRKLMPMWKRLADMFPSMASKGRVGSLDCGQPENKELCKRLGAKKLPQIHRFVGGAHEVWKRSLDASIEDFAAWGGGNDEL